MGGNRNTYILMSIGALMVLLNKPLAHSFREAQKGMTRIDYGIWRFRIPILLIGSLLVVLGLIDIFVGL